MTINRTIFVYRHDDGSYQEAVCFTEDRDQYPRLSVEEIDEAYRTGQWLGGYLDLRSVTKRPTYQELEHRIAELEADLARANAEIRKLDYLLESK